jgi:hypothetical protein
VPTPLASHLVQQAKFVFQLSGRYSDGDGQLKPAIFFVAFTYPFV